ncbi:RNA polymerase sigma factor [bacterium]|nr:RNA polymerase sigma factor [bacterium]
MPLAKVRMPDSTMGAAQAGGSAKLTSGQEEALLRRCLAGDWSEFGGIVDRYRALAWAAVDAAVDDKSAVPDLVQEVFIRVYEKLPTFRFQASFSTWLFRLARNHGLSWQRRQGRWSRRVATLDMGDAGSGAGHGRPIASGEQPEALYSEGARQRALSGMLARLPGKYRLVINLYYVKEYTYDEIATALELPVNTVRTHLRRGRERLLALSSEGGWR